MSYGITVKMADLSSVTSRVQSQTCTICRERHLKKQMVVQTPGSGIKVTSYKQYMFGLLFSIKVKKRLIQTKVHFKFFNLSESKRLTNLQK